MFSQDGLIFESQPKPVKEVKFSPFQDTQEVERWGRSIWLVDSTIVDMDEVKEGVRLSAESEWTSLGDLFIVDLSIEMEPLTFDTDFEDIAKLIYGDYPILGSVTTRQ